MKDRVRKKLKAIGGQNIKIKESNKSIEKKNKTTFIKLVTQFKETYDKSNDLPEKYGVNLIQYEDNYYKIIEILIQELYGNIAAEIILWWVYEVRDPKNEDYFIMDDESEKKYKIKSLPQLYTTLRKMKILK